MPEKRLLILKLIIGIGVIIQLTIEANKIYDWIPNDIRILAIIRITLLIVLISCLLYVIFEKRRVK